MTSPGGHGGGALLTGRPGRTHLSVPDPNDPPLLRHLLEAAEAAPRFQATGAVVRVVGTTVEAAGLVLQLGSICWIDLEPEGMVSAEVVGFQGRPDHSRSVRRSLRRAARIRRPAPGASVSCSDRAGRAGQGSGRFRTAARRPGSAPGRIPGHHRGRAAPAGPRPHFHSDLHGRASPGRPSLRRQGSAPWNLRRLRCRQIHAAGHDRPTRLLGRERDRPDRRARTRSPGVHRRATRA